MTATFSESMPLKWTGKRLKYAAPLRIERVDATSDHSEYLGLENIQSWTGKLLPMEADESAIGDDSNGGTASSFQKGDVLFGKLRPYLAKAFHADRKGVCSTEFLVLKPQPDVHSRFLLYAVLSRKFVDLVDASTFGAKMPRANWDFIGSMSTPIPSLDIQKRIANYLDRETTHIDTLIAEKEHMLSLLKEKRAALISQAVTRGLDPDVPLKPSDHLGSSDILPEKDDGDTVGGNEVSTVDLFSGLPANWQKTPLKRVCEFAVSNVDKHSLENELPVRLCNYTDVYRNEKVSPTLDLMIATATEEEIERFHLEENDVVITKDSESWDDIGVPAYVETTSDDFVCGYHLALIRPKKNLLDGRYLFRCMQSRPVALQLELEATGVTRYGIPKNAIGSALLPLPNLEAQTEIADYLDRETIRIDVLSKEISSSIELLKERRSALITAAVTGQIDPKDMTA